MIRFKEAEAAKGIEESRVEEPQGWSTAQQRDPDSGDDSLESASDDSWGSVVDTGVEALQQLMQGK